MKSPSRSALLAENAELHLRLEEAEQTLRAIRSGEVDALMIEGADGPQIYILQGQGAEANRTQAEMLAQVSDAVITIDAETRIIYLNPAAERLYNFPASRCLGQVLSTIYESRWLHPEEEEAAKTALREYGEWRGENVHIRHDGRELNVESGITVLRDIAGKRTGLLAVIRDVTERKQHEDKVLVSEIRYRRLFEAAHDGVLILDPETGKIVEANPFMTQLLGYRHDQLVGKELYQIGLLKDAAASQEMVRKLKQTNQVRYDDLPLESQRGQHQEVEVVANLYEENGRLVIQCNIRDITERKRTENHVKMLMAEVNHRAKNLLAVVQAVANQTAKHGDAATFASRLSERIGGLAAGQDLLVDNQWQGVKVADLIKAQLAHFGDLIGTRVLLIGPCAKLTADAAQGIGMALHELATNAAKYGALSNSEGRVRITWQVTADAKPRFLMSWLEYGGPKVAAPTRTGFGQIVIGRMAEAAVQGVAKLDYEATGVSWNLSTSLDGVLAQPG
ncbi:MAG TPA: PAS domain S-box protein [Candidatus Binataceae bacterium]|nr:PAS domain S-box protein [Candidatus Binataceae bacterium]